MTVLVLPENGALGKGHSVLAGPAVLERDRRVLGDGRTICDVCQLEVELMVRRHSVEVWALCALDELGRHAVEVDDG